MRNIINVPNFILGEQPGNFHEKITVQPISANSILIDSARQVEECESIRIMSKLVLGEPLGIFKQKHHSINFSTVQPTVADIMPIVSTRQHHPPKSCYLVISV
jgi:hypothetical protein